MSRFEEKGPPGVFSRQDAIRSHLQAHLNSGAPSCFTGTFEATEGEGFLVAMSGERYRVLPRGGDPNTLIRHLRTTLPTIREMDGGGYQVCAGFAILSAEPSSKDQGPTCWLLINVTVAREAIRLIEETFAGNTRPSRPSAHSPSRSTPSASLVALT